MKPNFIIIMTDQQRADLRASRGLPLDTMPFLDEWAKSGVDFTHAYTPNPICIAARISMFTGRTPETHQVRTNHNRMDATYTEDLLDIFKKNGYTTALCGKNHTHREPSDFDFAKTNGHLGGEGEINQTEAEKEFSNFLRSTNHLETDYPSPGGVTVQFPYRNVRDALDFIDTRDIEKPFFLWLSMAEPHNPSQVPAPYFDMFPPESLPPVSDKSALENKSERMRWLRRTWEEILGDRIEDRIARTRSNYFGMLRLIDDQLKRFIKGINERGLGSDTYIIYLSDHGDFVGEYGLLRKGGELAELMVNIPMIWHGPGIVPRLSPECVNIIDLLPTICDIISYPVPDGVQGKSILPLLKNHNIPEHEFDTAYSESGYGGLYWNDGDSLTLEDEGTSDKKRSRFDCLNTWTQCGKMRMVRKGNYKLQLDMNKEGYLYRLDTDPRELVNLWSSEEYITVKADMLTELAKAMLLHTDPLPYPHHRYRYKKHPLGYTANDYSCEDPGVSPLRVYNGHGITK